MPELARMIKRRWPEWTVLFLFIVLTLGAIIIPLASSIFAEPKYGSAFNAALSIGTSGIVAFIFYYVVNERLERKKRDKVRKGALQTYRDAKRNIALAIIHASQKGGRADLSADYDTIDKALSIVGFNKLFEGGQQADEGFYAFENQMSNHTPEYDEIIFNLKIIGRAFDRLVDNTHLNDSKSYNYFARLDALMRRIERNGPGYDESKLLCRFIWEIFAGWNVVQGPIGYDPIERAIETS
jgi:hypothetical protein